MENSELQKDVIENPETSGIQIFEEQEETSDIQEIQEINDLEKDIIKLLSKSFDANSDDSDNPKKIYFFTKINLKIKIFTIKRKINKKMEQLKIKKIVSLSNNNALKILDDQKAKRVNIIFNSLLAEKAYAIFKIKEKLSKQAIRVFSENKKANDFLALLEAIIKIKEDNLFLIKKWTLNFMIVTYLNKNRSNQTVTSLFLENGKDIDRFISDKLNPQNFKKEMQILNEVGFTLNVIENHNNYVPSPLAFTLVGYFTNWEKWNDNFLMESIKIMLIDKNPLAPIDSDGENGDASKDGVEFSDEQKYQLIFDLKRKNK